MITDERAAELIGQVMHLAIVIRDEGPDAAHAALAAVEDPWAALGVAAALLHVNEPVEAWWQAGLDRRCEDCHELIEGRGPAAIVCEPCRGERRRRTFRDSERRRRLRASATASQRTETAA